MLGATGGPGSLPRRDEPAGGWPPRPGCSVQPRPSPEAAPRAGTSVLPRPAETDLTGVDRATSVSGSPLNVGRNGRARLSCGGRTQRASASASPRYASERDSQSRHCQSTTVACRTKGRGGSGWCGRIGGVSGGLSPPEHLLRATAPGGSARWRDSIAIVVSGFKSKITFAGFAQTRDIILESLKRYFRFRKLENPNTPPSLMTRCFVRVTGSLAPRWVGSVTLLPQVDAVARC